MPSKKFVRKGYVQILKPDHPCATKWGYVAETRLIVEAYLNTILPKNIVVHHINGNKQDNRIENLQVFLSSKEHTKFHRDQRTLEACGNKDWRCCPYCHEYGDPKDPEWYQVTNESFCHRKCKSEYDRKRYERSGLCKYRTFKSVPEKMLLLRT